MDELNFNQQYYLDYLRGTHKNNRLWDIYLGMTSIRRPPFLDDIFREQSQMEALLILEGIKEEPWRMDLDESQWEIMYDNVWKDEEHIKMQVLDYEFQQLYEELMNDTLSYIEYNHLSILVKKTEYPKSNDIILMNAPVVNIW